VSLLVRVLVQMLFDRWARAIPILLQRHGASTCYRVTSDAMSNSETATLSLGAFAKRHGASRACVIKWRTKGLVKVAARVPKGALLLFAGFDCQLDHVEWVLLGLGPEHHKFVVDYGTLGKPTLRRSNTASTSYPTAAGSGCVTNARTNRLIPVRQSR